MRFATASAVPGRVCCTPLSCGPSPALLPGSHSAPSGLASPSCTSSDWICGEGKGRGRLREQDAWNHKHSMPTRLACPGAGNQQPQQNHTALRDPYLPCRGSGHITAARARDNSPSQHTPKVPRAVLASTNICPRKASQGCFIPQTHHHMLG